MRTWHSLQRAAGEPMASWCGLPDTEQIIPYLGLQGEKQLFSQTVTVIWGPSMIVNIKKNPRGQLFQILARFNTEWQKRGEMTVIH